MRSQDGSAVCGMTWGGVGVALGDIKGHPVSAKRHRNGQRWCRWAGDWEAKGRGGRDRNHFSLDILPYHLSFVPSASITQPTKN